MHQGWQGVRCWAGQQLPLACASMPASCHASGGCQPSSGTVPEEKLLTVGAPGAGGGLGTDPVPVLAGGAGGAAVPAVVEVLAPAATTDAGSCRVDPPAPPWATETNWSASQARRAVVHWTSLVAVAWIWASAGQHGVGGGGGSAACEAVPATMLV